MESTGRLPFGLPGRFATLDDHCVAIVPSGNGESRKIKSRKADARKRATTNAEPGRRSKEQTPDASARVAL